jgi:hypothetical protein
VAVDSDGDWSDFEERNGEDYETDDLDFDNVACSHCAAEAIWCETEEELESTVNGRVFSRILQAHNFSSGGVTSLNY